MDFGGIVLWISDRLVDDGVGLQPATKITMKAPGRSLWPRGSRGHKDLPGAFIVILVAGCRPTPSSTRRSEIQRTIPPKSIHSSHLTLPNPPWEPTGTAPNTILLV